MNKKEERMKNLRDAVSCINEKDRLYYVPKEEIDEFKKKAREEDAVVVPILEYGKKYICLKASCEAVDELKVSDFAFKNGTFKKAWGAHHKNLTLYPATGHVRKVEIQIADLDIRKLRMLENDTGDVIEDTATVKIKRHYKLRDSNKDEK